jgi:hypothetical protein
VKKENQGILLQLDGNPFFFRDYDSFRGQVILAPQSVKCEECDGRGVFSITETDKTWVPGTYTTYTTKKDAFGNNIMVSETKKSSFNGSWSIKERTNPKTCRA